MYSAEYLDRVSRPIRPTTKSSASFLPLHFPFNFPSNPDVPPHNGSFFSHISVGTRGYGKTFSTLQLLENVKEYYDKFYVISPSLEGDMKQKNFFEH